MDLVLICKCSCLRFLKVCVWKRCWSFENGVVCGEGFVVIWCLWEVDCDIRFWGLILKFLVRFLDVYGIVFGLYYFFVGKFFEFVFKFFLWEYLLIDWNLVILLYMCWIFEFFVFGLFFWGMLYFSNVYLFVCLLVWFYL